MSEEMQAAPAEQAPTSGTTATRSAPRKKTPVRAAGSRRGAASSAVGSAGTDAALDPTRDDPMQSGRRIWPD
jgi:hypothetical protein